MCASQKNTNIEYISDIYVHVLLAWEEKSKEAFGGFTDVCLEMSLLNYSASRCKEVT